MPRFDVLTLFDAYFQPLREHGVSRRAFDTGALVLRTWNPRDFADDAHRSVDDRPYGGGPGMVMLAGPLEHALRAAQADRRAADLAEAPVLLFSPAGKALDQQTVARWAQSAGAVLVCGRYEGVDQRFIERRVDEEVSLGDYVLSGGEIAALALLDAVARLLPGVLGCADSSAQDSFSDGLLDCPHYTRPPVFEGLRVPEVLLGGDHARIARHRRDAMLRLTQARRPELIEYLRRARRLSRRDEEALAEPPPDVPGTGAA